MIIHRSLSPRNTNDTNTSSSPQPTSGATTHLLNHTNLVGVLVIAALLVLGIILWLCFGKWSKPIRRFLRREPCSSPVVDDSVGIGSDATKKKKGDEVAPASPTLGRGDADADPEKAAMAQSGSCDCSLDQDAIVEVEVELTPPEKGLQAFTIKSGSQLARLSR
ncbi:hypothetical protein BGW80DRAFT_1453370 [Lactifluus volemus]|nr:hypothetical protein BGW80DRAFT_1453370 [Lactifluus volemus]